MNGDYDQYADKYDIDEAEKTLPLTKRPIFSIILVGIGFMINFACFFVIQALQFQINESIGLCSLVAFHASSFVCGLFVAPGVVHKIGENIAMAIGASSCCLYAFANPAESTAPSIITAILSGFGQGILWTSACVYVTGSCSERTRGRYFTSFYTFYSFAQLVGFLSLALFHVGSNDYYMRSDQAPIEGALGDLDFLWLFRVLGIIQLVSGALFLFPRKMIRSTLISNNIDEFGFENITNTLSVGGLYYYVPIVATTAMSMSLLYSDVVYAINDTAKASWTLVLFGGVHCVWAIFSVKIVKMLFDSFLALVSVAFVPLAYVFVTLGTQSWWWLFAAGAAFGFVDSSISYALNKVCIRDYPKQIAGCMSVRIAFSSFGYMLGFIFSLGMALSTKLLIVVLCHIIALSGFVLKELQRFNAKTDLIRDTDGKINVGAYDSTAVKRAVLEDEKRRERPQPKPKTKKKPKSKLNSDLGSETLSSYEEFSTEF